MSRRDGRRFLSLSLSLASKRRPLEGASKAAGVVCVERVFDSAVFSASLSLSLSACVVCRTRFLSVECLCARFDSFVFARLQFPFKSRLRWRRGLALSLSLSLSLSMYLRKLVSNAMKVRHFLP